MNQAPKQLKIYVDGSFVDGKIGFGAVIVHNSEVEHEISGAIDDPTIAAHRQVGGELYAVLESLSWCKDNGIVSVDLYYDYIGVEAWPTGKWKANKELTKRYVRDVKNSGINILWHKVKAHSGDKWNEHADKLAKKGTLKGSIRTPSPDNPLSFSNKSFKIEKIAQTFAQFVEDDVITASVFDKKESLYCRVELYDGLIRVGIVDIYNTNSCGLKPDFRGFSDPDLKEITASKWITFLQKLANSS
jgi:ribonuclease HI